MISVKKSGASLFCLFFSTNSYGSLSVAAGIGPGLYKTENMFRDFSLSRPQDTPTQAITSLFKTKPAPFCAVSCSGIIEPQKNALLSALITGGTLPSGKACFITTDYPAHAKSVCDPAHFNGHFFISAYGSGGINFPVSSHTSLQTFLGFGLNSEYLNVCIEKPKKLKGRFTRRYLAPLWSIAGTYTRQHTSISCSYQLMAGTAYNTVTYPSLRMRLNITIPCVMNSVGFTIAHTYKNTITAALNASYSQLNNYKNGRVSPYIDCIAQSNAPSVIRYVIRSLALYGQITILF